MSLPPFPQWTALGRDARFTDPAQLAMLTNQFERQIRRRNWIEYAAGTIGVLLSCGLGLFFAAKGEWALAAPNGVLGIGFVIVMRNLSRRAGRLARFPEEPCIDHLRRHYRQQADALRSVGAWYVGPLVPGLVAIQGAVTWSLAQARGWTYALEELAGPAALLAVIVIAVIALNRWAARDLEAKLAALDERA